MKFDNEHRMGQGQSERVSARKRHRVGVGQVPGVTKALKALTEKCQLSGDVSK